MSAERLGFACVWDADREGTWSHIPHNLLLALRGQATVSDLKLEHGDVLTRLHHRQNRRHGQPEWVPRPWSNWLRRASLERQVHLRGIDKVLQVNDLAVTSRPYWLYRDMTWEQVAEHGGDTATGIIDRHTVEHQARRERRIIRKAEGVFTFSEWAAVSARSQGARQVVVIPPGVNVPLSRQRVPRPRDERRNLLFVGRAFERKGGSDVLEAFVEARKKTPDLTLTIVGPGVWPVQLPPSDGVRFLGALPLRQLSAVFTEADLFVLPSRFEAYGIALVEALAFGLPCVARQVCAMPEILDNGRWGVLVTAAGDSKELASAIIDALLDDDLHARVAVEAQHLATTHTWEVAASSMVAAMGLC